MYANDAKVPIVNPHRLYRPILSVNGITEGFRKDLLLIALISLYQCCYTMCLQSED